MMEHDEKDDGGARSCRVCEGHRFHPMCKEMPQEDIKQGRDMIQFMFLKGNSISIQALPLKGR